jgi:predicted N-acetyltransferase YhbS
MTTTLTNTIDASTPQYRRARPADAGAIRRLWADHFPATEPDDTLIARATDLSRPDTVGFVCRDRGRVVACGLQTYQDPTDLYDLPPDLLPDTPHPDAVFLLTAVEPSRRREGIGRQLAEHRIAAAKRRDCGRVIGCAWQQGAALLRDLGFEYHGTVDDYFDYDPGAIDVHALSLEG